MHTARTPLELELMLCEAEDAALMRELDDEIRRLTSLDDAADARNRAWVRRLRIALKRLKLETQGE